VTSVLQIDQLRAFYGASEVLHGVSLDLPTGGATAILGANGAGKTTLLRAICGLIRTEGRISFAGSAIHGWATEDIIRAGIALVPEGRGTFTDLTVEENFRLGMMRRHDRAAAKADLDLLLGYFPRLKDRWRQQAGTLSGGEQQMLAISRALMLKPKLLLLDEPSFGLAPLVIQEIFRILARVKSEQGVSILIVEQNARLALELSDSAYLLETGRIVLQGTSREMIGNDHVRRSYLGY
jgi:branched-chain amino acid transport system ATP-binding protein